MITSKITRRWLRNSFAVIVVMILLIEAIAAFGIQRYHYSQVSQMLQSQAEAAANSIDQISRSSSGDFMIRVRNYVSSFSKKDQMELLVLDEFGQTIFTSSGFLPQNPTMPDYLVAQEQPNGIGTAIGTLDGHQRVMLLALISPAQDESGILAIRLATDLTLVDRQIFYTVVVLVLLGVAILSLVLFSSSYFISGIVRPIAEVGVIARQIAEGDFDARVTINKDDEIGDLAGIINYMAGELDTAERLKNDFISSVSHELRTPLTAIQGWGETILFDGGQDRELLDKGMHVIIGETNRLSGMVEELLDFSKMQSGRLKLIKSRMDAIRELSEAVTMYTQRAEREQITMTYQANCEFAEVYGDKNRLRQVFINIIDNAIKYSDPGDHVDIQAQTKQKELLIMIADTGIGISEQDLPQIKSKFYKADSTRRGSGIGLAVAEEIVTRHGGTLNVTSQKGEGTAITITLPLYSGQEEGFIEEPPDKA